LSGQDSVRMWSFAIVEMLVLMRSFGCGNLELSPIFGGF
jgi:hypothetical protein